MNIRTYCWVSAMVFTVVALAHLARLIYGSSIVIDGEAIPMLASWVGVIVPGVLAFWGFRGARGAR
jgi:hypothetical protein